DVAIAQPGAVAEGLGAVGEIHRVVLHQWHGDIGGDVLTLDQAGGSHDIESGCTAPPLLREDLEDAARRLRAVDHRRLRSPDDLDPLDVLRVDGRDPGRVRDLDAIDVDLDVVGGVPARV